jgi:hypothetical protein
MRSKTCGEMLDAHQQLVLLRLEEVDAAKRIVCSEPQLERRG